MPKGHPTARTAVPGLGAAALNAGGAQFGGSFDTSQVITITSDTSIAGASLGVSVHLKEPQPANRHGVDRQA